MGDTDALRDKIAQAALDAICPTNCNHRISSGGMMTDWNTGRVSINHTQGGPCAVHRSLSAILADAVLPVVTQEVEALRRDRDDLEATLKRVVANESNHYDRYWTPPPTPLTKEWLAETEAKMREALTDAFCDDAAAVMLTLIADIRLLRSRVEALAHELDKEATLTIHPETARSFPTSYVAHLGRRGGLRDAAQRLRRSLSDNKEQQQ